MNATPATTTKPRACTLCASPFPVHPPGHCGGTGYALRPDGSAICYPCADASQRAELLDRSRPFVAYLSSDGRTVTTWTGGLLMQVTRCRTVRLNRPSFTHGRTIQSVRATDCHGGEWIGQSSPGIAIRLRPVQN